MLSFLFVLGTVVGAAILVRIALERALQLKVPDGTFSS